jgi:small subunit ribosomal protein S8
MVKKTGGLSVSSDNIADMLTKIRNAQKAGHDSVSVPLSKIKLEIIKILKNEGFIKNFKVYEGKSFKNIRIFLKYDNFGVPVIKNLSKVSKPGMRIYKNKEEVPRILNGLGVVVVSTSKGVLTGRKAKEEGIGGEVLCHIY